MTLARVVSDTFVGIRPADVPGFPENTASVALHERAGFRTVGVYRRHGQLEGQWCDCVIIEKLLGPAAHG